MNGRAARRPVLVISTAVCVVVPALVLVGWQFGIESIKSLIPGEATMNPLTAVTCLLEGSSLYLLAGSLDHGTAKRIAFFLLSLATMLTSLRLCSYAFGWSMSPDRWLWPGRVADQVPQSEMSPNTALGLLAASISGLMHGLKGKRGVAAAQILGIATAVAGAIVVASYIIGSTQAATVAGSVAMSLPSGTMLLFLGVGAVFVAPQMGPVSAFTGAGASAKLARRLLLTSAGLVILINLLRLWGEFSGLYGRQVSILLFSTVVVAGLAVVIGYATRAYAREEAARIAAEEATRTQAKFVREVVDAIPGYVYAKDKEGRYVFANAAVARQFDASLEDVIGKRTIDFVADSAEVRQFLESDARVIQTGQTESFEASISGADGSKRWLYNSKRPLDSPQTGERLVFGIVTDITELVNARQEAQRANQAKSEFLSRMSHELRTPLNAVIGFSQLIQINSTDEKTQEAVTQVIKAGGHLLQLINEVLDLARVESGQLAVSIEPVIIDDAVRMAMGIVRPMADERQITIETESSSCDETAMLADRQRLAQIVINLLSNAIKYNMRGGSVRIQCGEGGGRAFIEVTDTGRGIPDDQRHRLFAPFERINGADVEGTGLGLSLSLRLAVVMGGSLDLTASSPTGSTFRLELPRAEISQVQTGLQPGPDKSVTDELRVGKEGATILYIEDNLANLRLVESVLREWGPVTVLSAMQGSIGLEIVRTRRPSLVLLDLHLPDMSGMDVLREIRLDARTSSIPVVILSADATAGQIQRGRSQGADEFLSKPFDVARLMGILSEWQERGWER